MIIQTSHECAKYTMRWRIWRNVNSCNAIIMRPLLSVCDKDCIVNEISSRAGLSWIISMLSLYGVAITISALYASLYGRVLERTIAPGRVYAHNEWLTGKIRAARSCGARTGKFARHLRRAFRDRARRNYLNRKNTVNNRKRAPCRKREGLRDIVAIIAERWKLYF